MSGSTTRFISISEADLESLDNDKDSLSTKRTVTRSVKLFREFLGSEANFEEMPRNILDQKLRLFFASVRTVKGGELKKTTMHSVKYGLSKYMKDTCNVDISKDEDFSSSKRTFKAKLKDLQNKGKGAVEHKEQITDHDLHKLMQPENVAFNIDTPCGLQNKVWFDVMFHLCRRGRENLRPMTKSTFAVETDSSGREYVRQIIDEADKNHGADASPDDTIGEARMYAQGGTMCPVTSFKKYVDKLHPEMDDLWQRPRESFLSTETVWYYKSALGKNTLCSMMRSISVIAKLSKKYTNHCIRATSICALDRAGFEARHIIRATGHKSESSIKSYSRRLTEDTQRHISDTLSTSLNGPTPPVTGTGCNDLTVEELNRIFSNENEYSEINDPQPGSENNTNATASNVPSNCNHQQTNVANIMPGSPNIVNFPGNSANGRFWHIAPTMNNCTVSFHFHGK